jgi:tRNA-dihydrouridine synthase
VAAESEGAAAVTLHARTLAEHYSGCANWDYITQLKAAIRTIPVLGNGDVFTAADAARMVRQTGCDGVAVGPGCLGRPWLFADLEALFAGRDDRVRPRLGFVLDVVRRHAAALVEYTGSEQIGLRLMRAHMTWYLKGYRVGGPVRDAARRLSSLEELDGLCAMLDPAAPYPGEAAEGPRAKGGGPKCPRLPDGWMDSRELSDAENANLPAGELDTSGG